MRHRVAQGTSRRSADAMSRGLQKARASRQAYVHPENSRERLPDLPSELIALALRDMRAVMRKPLYRINMSIWHEPRYTARDGRLMSCSICMAGAVMAGTLRADPGRHVLGTFYSRDTACKISAINAFRTGRVQQGILYMRGIRFGGRAAGRVRRELTEKGAPLEMYIPEYDGSDPEVFFRAMHRMKRLLRRAGL